jgi:hypothetical protein
MVWVNSPFIRAVLMNRTMKLDAATPAAATRIIFLEIENLMPSPPLFKHYLTINYTA